MKKIVPKAGNDMYIVQHTGENLSMTATESRNINSDAALGTSLELVTVVKEASRDLQLFLSFTTQLENLKSICACTESTDFYNLIGLQ